MLTVMAARNILGVAEDASRKDVKEAYLARVRVWRATGRHPGAHLGTRKSAALIC